MPKYLVKWPDEAGWLAWLTALTGIWTVVGVQMGWPAEVVGAVAAFIPITGRLLTGMFLPTPTLTQEIASARESMDDVSKPLEADRQPPVPPAGG